MFKAILLLVAIILLIIILLAIWLGLFDKIDINMSRFKGGTLIYIENQCSYNQLSGQFEKLISQTRPYFKEEERELCGLYFDNPNSIKDSFMSRSAIGILIDPSNDELEARAREFVSRRPNYKAVNLPEVNCFVSRLEYKCFLSVFLFSRIWNALSLRVEKEGFRFVVSPPGIEVYNENNGKWESTEFFYPVEGDLADYIISSYPKPQSK